SPMSHAARDSAELTMAVKKLQLPQQPLPRAPIVGIQPRDKFASSCGASTLQCFGNSEGRLGQYPNPWLGARSRCENASSPILRAVIHRQKLPIWQRLTRDAVEHNRKRSGGVAHGHDNRN